nr:hypothetical protein [uncultured Albidiferax sp.]
MFSIPFPFLSAIFLVLLLAQMTWRQGRVVLANRRFRILLGGYALLSVLAGLRWGHHVTLLLPLQATLAVALAAWSWCCFAALAHGGGGRWQLLHVLPALVVVLLFAWWPEGVDAVVVAALAGYGLALLRLARRGPDVLVAHRALWMTALLLMLSAVLELLVAGGIPRMAGRHAAMVVGGFHLVVLLLAGYAASMAGNSVPDAQGPEA